MKKFMLCAAFLVSMVGAGRARAQPWVALHVASSDARLFVGPYNNESYSNNDWAVNEHKAECGSFLGNPMTTMVGISYHVDPKSCGFFGTGCFAIAYTSAVVCSASSIHVVQTANFRLWDGAGTSRAGDNRRDLSWGDWAYGLRKLECGPTEVITGVADDWAMCSATTNLRAPQSCNVRRFSSGDGQSTPNRGDWDYGSYKGECATGEYIKGVAGEAPTAILCCAPSF